MAGKLVDDRGVPMFAVRACKGKIRYRYYVSRDLQRSGDASSTEGWRLPAREIEPLVRTRVMAFLVDPIHALARTLNEVPSADNLKMTGRGKAAAARLAGPRGEGAKLLRDIVAEVRLGTGQVSIVLDPPKLGSVLEIIGMSETVTLNVTARLKRSGHMMKMITQTGSAVVPTVDRTLVKSIVQGRIWWEELQANTKLTLEDIGRREGVTGAYVVRIVRLAFLSPQMLSSMADGTLTAHRTVKRLTMPDAIAARWDRQQPS